MKKIIDIIGSAALAATVVGCKSIPESDTAYACANAIGTAAALVANQCSLDDGQRQTVIKIVGVVRDVVPETNQTFVAAWTPIAQSYVDKMVAEGKIDAAGGVAVMSAFEAVTVGIDYVFYRYPTAKAYEELTSAAVNGFCDGFLAVFSPSSCARGFADCLYDATAYKHISSHTRK